MDSQNEAMVQSSIDELLKNGGATAVVVAHRLSTVKNAHKIVVIEKGKVVQIGPHDELVKDVGGRYEMLVRTQLIGNGKNKKTKKRVDQEGDGEDDFDDSIGDDGEM